MAIVNMKKFNLLVLESNREELLRELQIFRSVQFEDSKEVEEFDEELISKFGRPNFEDDVSEYDEKINRCNYAIELISKHSPVISGLKSLIKGLPNYTFDEMEKRISQIDFEGDYSTIKDLGDRLAKAESGISKRKELIKEIEPISNLDISFEKLSRLNRFDVFIGGVSVKILNAFIEELAK